MERGQRGVGEVGVEAGEEHEEGSDEIIDSSCPRIRRNGDTNYVDDGYNCAAQVLK